LGACASVGTYTAIDLPGTEETYVVGIATSSSEARGSHVSMHPVVASQNASARQQFTLTVENVGSRPFNIGPEQISVFTDKGVEVAVIAPEQLEKEAQQESAWVSFNAGVETTSNTITGVAGGFEDGDYDAAAAQQTQLAAKAANDTLAEETEARLSQISASASLGGFHRQTVSPGQHHTASVTLDKIPKDTTRINVEVRLGDDLHSFAWGYSVQ
jgi:hypothetical protein